MREHLRKCGIHVFRKQIKAGGNGNIICFFARSIKNVECGVQRPVQIPGHCFGGTRNKTCEFFAAELIWFSRNSALLNRFSVRSQSTRPYTNSFENSGTAPWKTDPAECRGNGKDPAPVFPGAEAEPSEPPRFSVPSLNIPSPDRKMVLHSDEESVPGRDKVPHSEFR